jgi:hypothetical protein
MSSLGYNVASKDILVNVLLKKVIEKEESYIHQYIKLKELYPQCIDLPIKTEFEKLLEVKRLSLEYKLQSKEKQHSALLKLLEYLNNLEEKIQKLESQENAESQEKVDTQEILEKMSILENDISKLQKAIYS